MTHALDRPPTWRQELKLFLKIAPRSLFGLPFYAIMLLSGRIDPSIRCSIIIAVVIGGIFTGLVAMSMIVWAPPGATAAYMAWGAVSFGTAAATLSGILIYNRVNHGFYL